MFYFFNKKNENHFLFNDYDINHFDLYEIFKCYRDWLS